MNRSWYNRAGVERVTGFCNDAEHEEFMLAEPDPEIVFDYADRHLQSGAIAP